MQGVSGSPELGCSEFLFFFSIFCSSSFFFLKKKEILYFPRPFLFLGLNIGQDRIDTNSNHVYNTVYIDYRIIKNNSIVQAMQSPCFRRRCAETRLDMCAQRPQHDYEYVNMRHGTHMDC